MTIRSYHQLPRVFLAFCLCAGAVLQGCSIDYPFGDDLWPNSEPDSSTNCDKCDYKACSNGNLYCFDCSGSRSHMDEFCSYGCADGRCLNPVVVEDIHEDYTAQPSCEELCAQNERECGTYLDCTCGDCSTGFVCENGKCEREIDPCIEICMQRDCGEFSGCNCGGCANLWTCNGGKCVECKPDVIEKCVDSKIYSFDSCGNRGKLSYDCVTRCKSYGDTYKKCEWDDNWDRGRCICSKQQEGDYWEFNCSYSSNYSSCSIVFGESKLCVLPSFGSYSSSATKHHCDRIPCPKDGNCQALCGKQIFCGEDLKVKCQCDIVNEPMCGFTLPGCVYR